MVLQSRQLPIGFRCHISFSPPRHPVPCTKLPTSAQPAPAGVGEVSARRGVKWGGSPDPPSPRATRANLGSSGLPATDDCGMQSSSKAMRVPLLALLALTEDAASTLALAILAIARDVSSLTKDAGRLCQAHHRNP